jgi:hypothetical protein
VRCSQLSCPAQAGIQYSRDSEINHRPRGGLDRPPSV